MPNRSASRRPKPNPRDRPRRDGSRVPLGDCALRARDRVSRVRARVSGEALMTAAGWAQLFVLIALLAISTPLLGNYMARVYSNKRAPGDRIFLPVERVIYRVCNVDPESEQRWQTYAISLLAFSFASLIVLYVQLRLQGHLPLNPDG